MLTFGQEILISSISTGSSARLLPQPLDIPPVHGPHTLTIILVSYFFKNGISLLQKEINSRILQANGIHHTAINLQPLVGVGFPAHGTFATPLVSHRTQICSDPHIQSILHTGAKGSGCCQLPDSSILRRQYLLLIFIRFPPP